MNAREKKLVLIVGSIVALFVAVFATKAMFMKPLRDIDKKTVLLREKLEKIKGERRAYFAAEDVLKGFAKRTFSDQLSQASAISGEILTKQILLSGLEEADFSRLPVGPRKLRGANEIGWNIQGQGALDHVVNLIFLLQESPYLNRIENLAISSGEAPGQARVGFRFLTLVLDVASSMEIAPLEASVTLDSPERLAFNGIVERDIFRPYIKRPPEEKRPPEQSPAAPPGPATLRVVSLSDWGGEPEVHLRDLNTQETRRYKIGDELAEGVIVMVDYRPLPLPGNEALNSFSRVIIRVGTEYWAIERGQTLADKRPLAPDQAPESLPKL